MEFPKEMILVLVLISVGHSYADQDAFYGEAVYLPDRNLPMRDYPYDVMPAAPTDPNAPAPTDPNAPAPAEPAPVSIFDPIIPPLDAKLLNPAAIRPEQPESEPLAPYPNPYAPKPYPNAPNPDPKAPKSIFDPKKFVPPPAGIKPAPYKPYKPYEPTKAPAPAPAPIKKAGRPTGAVDPADLNPNDSPTLNKLKTLLENYMDSKQIEAFGNNLFKGEPNRDEKLEKYIKALTAAKLAGGEPATKPATKPAPKPQPKPEPKPQPKTACVDNFAHCPISGIQYCKYPSFAKLNCPKTCKYCLAPAAEAPLALSAAPVAPAPVAPAPAGPAPVSIFAPSIPEAIPEAMPEAIPVAPVAPVVPVAPVAPVVEAPKPAPICADVSSRCSFFGDVYCKNPAYEDVCPVTCKVCVAPAPEAPAALPEVPAVAAPAPVAPAAPAPAPVVPVVPEALIAPAPLAPAPVAPAASADCVDKFDHCPTSGVQYCKYPGWAKLNCPKTCNVC